MRIRHIAVMALAVTATFLCITSCSDDPAEPQPVESLQSFSLVVPDTVTPGEDFSLTVEAVGSEGSKPFISFDGTVSLAASGGTVTPDTLVLAAGTGAGQVVLSGAEAVQTITATYGNITGSAPVNAELMDALPGEDGDPANEAIPGFAFTAVGDDYSDNHPDLPGILISHNILMVSFEPATTVGQANVIIADLGAGIVGGIPGVNGIGNGVLFLKLPTDTQAEAQAAMDDLEANPAVRIAIQDVLMGTNAIPRANNGDPAQWTWESTPFGANWGLERIRVPQMWNFNEAVAKKLATQAFSPSAVLIVDTGFALNHPDVYSSNFSPVIPTSHGTHMAGIIGATFDNGEGIDGICPQVFMLGISALVDGGFGVYADKMSFGQAVISGLYWGMRAYVDVVNISLGYNWAAAGIDSDSDTQAQNITIKQAQVLVDMLLLREVSYRSPLIVVSAGNDGDQGYGEQFARFSSPLAYAGLEMGIENILVVEAVMDQPGTGDGNVTREPTSNIGGHVSAPGHDVWGTGNPPALYQNGTGTSYAAAMVSGVAAYIRMVEPYITFDDIKEVILANALWAGDKAQPRIDAWASVVDIDRVRGNDNVLQMMCDIDDGTLDGNQRLDYATGADYLEEDADGDGGVGDGTVDMSDFRRWRDWYLMTQNSLEFDLDGSIGHAKKDVNDNSMTEGPDGESCYPRGDFNGDGLLDPAATSWVPGFVNDDASDLDVFDEMFSFPGIMDGELPGLVESFDVHIDLGRMFSVLSLTEAGLGFWHNGSWYIEALLTAADTLSIFTLPCVTEGYELEIDFDGPYGREYYEFGHDPDLFTLLPGEDIWLEPYEFWEIDPRASYLHVCWDDAAALETIPLDLGGHDIQQGDFLLIDQVGYYDGGGGWTNLDNMAGVFSSSNVLLDGGQLNRVQGAIDAGEDIWTIPTHACGGETTDIPEDFEIRPYVVIQVPAGANFLFLAPNESKYSDNINDGNYRVQISKIRMKGYR